MMEDKDENPLAFLGLQRVGTESPSKTVQNDIELNRRGLPARKRKKNSRFCDGSDEVVTSPAKSPKKKQTQSSHSNASEDYSQHSPRKVLKSHPTENYQYDSDSYDHNTMEEEDKHGITDEDMLTLESKALSQDMREELFEKVKKYEKVNRRKIQDIGYALRNLLKLPKGHRWVYFEFFYSDIDRVLLCSENDFEICLRETFPDLKTRKMTRVEWSKIRRLLGKPRRCSESFFTEERRELNKKRMKIRFLQQRKTAGESSQYKDLPEDIPMQLTIGSQVTARLRSAGQQDGLFSGRVAAVDTSNSTYRVTFDREGLGTHSIPDYEVLSSDPPEMISLSSFLTHARPRPPSYLPPAHTDLTSLHLTNDPLLSGSTPKGKSLSLDGVLGGYPIEFLYHIVKLNNSLLVGFTHHKYMLRLSTIFRPNKTK